MDLVVEEAYIEGWEKPIFFQAVKSSLIIESLHKGFFIVQSQETNITYGKHLT